MKVNSNLDLIGNQLRNFRLQPVENFPANSQPGSFIFKDKRVMICVELDAGLPIWVPLTQELNTHIHDQAVANVTWTINHDLNSSSTLVQIIDTDGKHVHADEITQTLDTTVITFAVAQAGRAILMLGSDEGVQRANFAYEQAFSVASTTWVVSHMLGEEPLIRVFVGNQEVQPLSIVHDTLNQATVTFSTPQVGLIRAM